VGRGGVGRGGVGWGGVGWGWAWMTSELKPVGRAGPLWGGRGRVHACGEQARCGAPASAAENRAASTLVQHLAPVHQRDCGTEVSLLATVGARGALNPHHTHHVHTHMHARTHARTQTHTIEAKEQRLPTHARDSPHTRVSLCNAPQPTRAQSPYTPCAPRKAGPPCAVPPTSSCNGATSGSGPPARGPAAGHGKVGGGAPRGAEGGGGVRQAAAGGGGGGREHCTLVAGGV
jgi:hypothetical protein